MNTFDDILTTHAERLRTAYNAQTFGDASETGILIAFLMDLKSAGLVQVKGW